MHGLVITAGERIQVDTDVAWVTRVVTECADGMLLSEGAAERPTIRVHVDASHRPFEVRGWHRLHRDAWTRRGAVVVEDVCTSGMDMQLRVDDAQPVFRFRFRPPWLTRAARIGLPARARLLTRAVLLQYPALWWAGIRGRSPIHAPAVTTGERASTLLVGPGGAGKSALVAQAITRGGAATGDNVSVGDGVTVWGVVEPMRIADGAGRAMPHGRHEEHLPNRALALTPDLLVVMRRGDVDAVRSCDPADAAWMLTASTYVAGELRRYWPLAAMLAMGTGVGPAHPPLSEVAAAFARSVPCLDLVVPDGALPDLDVVRAAVGASEVRP